jgi:hypothetical protein
LRRNRDVRRTRIHIRPRTGGSARTSAPDPDGAECARFAAAVGTCHNTPVGLNRDWPFVDDDDQ